MKRLDIANIILQSSHGSLTSALESIKSVREDIQVLRTDDVKIEQVIAEAKKVTIDEDARRKRATETSYRLKDFVITDRLPNRDDANLRQIVVQSIDMIEGEFETRFADSYIEIWSAMEALLPFSPNFRDIKHLLPLYKYAASIPKVKQKLAEHSLEKTSWKPNPDIQTCFFQTRLVSFQSKGKSGYGTNL